MAGRDTIAERLRQSMTRALSRTQAPASPLAPSAPASAGATRKAFESLAGRNATYVVTGPVGYLEMPFLFEILGVDAPTATVLRDRGIEAAITTALKDIGVSTAAMVALERGLATLAFECGSQAISFVEALGAETRALNARRDTVSMVFKTGMATGEVTDGDRSAGPLRTALQLSKACPPGSLLISPDTQADADAKAAAFSAPENAGTARAPLPSHRAGPELAYSATGPGSFGALGAIIRPRRARHLWWRLRDRLAASLPQPKQYGRLF